jgi:methionyl-tRNA formyltransferase
VRIVFLGTPDFAVPALESLLDAGHEVAGVVTQPDRSRGRHRHPTPPPVKVFAASRGLRVCQPESVNAPAFREELARLAPELAVVVAFGQKLGRRLLRLPRHGCINVHFSLLPRHRGAAPVAHAILAGDAETGVTILRMTETIDAGDVLAQETTPIGPRETAGQLAERLAPLGACLLVKAISSLAAGHAQPVPQDPAKSTPAPSFDKEDGAIAWARPADCLARFVRAMNPWPGAFTFWTRAGCPPLRLVVHEAEAAAGRTTQPGRIVSADGTGIGVETGEGILRMVTLQPAGGRAMPVGDFLRGHPLSAGHTFGPASPA